MHALVILLVLAALLTPSSARAECDPAGRCCDDTDCCTDGRDNDGDGLVDCDDPSCSTIPPCGSPSPEDCGNGADDDGDTLVDCDDPDCATDPDCPPPGEGDCTDGEDGDGDGLEDCDDPDCATDPACDAESDCANGEDDDEDGLVDCADARDCADDPACRETRCDDGEDDDGDGLVDCDDADCSGVGCCAGPERCDDLRDNDGDGLIDCEDVDRCIDADVCALPGETCDDGRDDDGDELVDCADPQCVRFAACPPVPEPPAPPVLTPNLAEAACLWPPNHWWACLHASDLAIEATGGCAIVEVLLVDCVSSQPADAAGDGSTVPDCVVSGDRACLRAERAGDDPTGRVYTLWAIVVDQLGRVSEPQPIATVRVPHDATSASGCVKVTEVGSRTLPSGP
jgi:hypothetical protein